MRQSLRITVLLLAAGLVVLAAGCGGGSNGSAPPTTETTNTQQQTTTGSSGAGFASAKNCRDFGGLAAKIASAMAPTSGGTQSAIQAESRLLQAYANAAPSEVRGDFQTFATAFSSYMQALQSSGYKLGSTTPPTAAQLAALTRAAKAFSTTKLTQAEQHLSAWAQANCK